MLVGQVDISVDRPGGASAVDEPPFLLASGLWPRLSLSLCLFISALSSLFFFLSCIPLLCWSSLVFLVLWVLFYFITLIGNVMGLGLAAIELAAIEVAGGFHTWALILCS